MDSTEKTAPSEIDDDLDFEPMNLDFELPPIDESDLDSDLDSDFMNLGGDEEAAFAEFSGLESDLPEVEAGDMDSSMAMTEDATLDDLEAEPIDFTAEDSPSFIENDDAISEADPFASVDEDEPITLTADELSDIVSVDFEMEPETELDPTSGRSEIESAFTGEAGDIGVDEEASEDGDLDMGDEDLDSGDYEEEADEDEDYDIEPMDYEPEPEETEDEDLGDLEELDLEMPELPDAIEADDALVMPDDLDMDLTDLSDREYESDAAEMEGSLPEGEEGFDFNEPGDLAEDLSVTLDPEGDDGDIALSDHELDTVLDEEMMSADSTMNGGMSQEGMALELSDEELQAEVLGDEVQLPQLSILDADEDESITLTADELSNIVSDESAAETSADSPFGDGEEIVTDDLDIMDAAPVQEFDGFETSSAEDESPLAGMSIDEDDEQPSFFQDEEEGPVALTDAELADILEETGIEEEVAEAVTEPVLGPAAEPRSEVMAEELAMETGIKRDELKKVIGYLDDLLGQLPEETVKEFSRSEYFNLYKKVIEELGVFK